MQAWIYTTGQSAECVKRRKKPDSHFSKSNSIHIFPTLYYHDAYLNFSTLEQNRALCFNFLLTKNSMHYIRSFPAKNDNEIFIGRNLGSAPSCGGWRVLACCVMKAPHHLRANPPNHVQWTPLWFWTLRDLQLSVTTGEHSFIYLFSPGFSLYGNCHTKMFQNHR